MALHQPAQGGGESLPVELAGEVQQVDQVVGRAAGRQAVEEPEPLLGEGQRRRAGVGPARNPLRLGRNGLAPQPPGEQRLLLRRQFRDAAGQVAHGPGLSIGSRPQSWRSTVAGSMRMARRAGSRTATSPMPTKMTATHTNVERSLAAVS